MMHMTEVKEQEKYFDTGKQMLQWSSDCHQKEQTAEYICSRRLQQDSLQQRKGTKAYDEDCKKQAIQLGLD